MVYTTIVLALNVLALLLKYIYAEELASELKSLKEFLTPYINFILTKTREHAMNGCKSIPDLYLWVTSFFSKSSSASNEQAFSDIPVSSSQINNTQAIINVLTGTTIDLEDGSCQARDYMIEQP